MQKVFQRFAADVRGARARAICAPRTFVIQTCKGLHGWRAGGARTRDKFVQEVRGLRAARFQNVVLVLAPRTLFLKRLQEFHGFPWPTCQKWRFGRTQE
eukprot:8096944-Pyramimonas_sp.AAC.1